MKTPTKNIEMTRGDTLSFAFEIEGINQDLETAYFTINDNLDEETPIVQKSLIDGISKIETGDDYVQYRVRVAPDDTKEIEPGHYFYDLEIGLNSDVFTILKGQITLEADVTR